MLAFHSRYTNVYSWYILVCISIATFSTSSGYLISMSFNIGHRSLSHGLERSPISSGLWNTRSYREWQRPRANRCSLSARIYMTMDKPEIESPARLFRQTLAIFFQRARAQRLNKKTSLFSRSL